MKRPTDDSTRDLLAALPDASVDDVAIRRLRQRVIDSVGNQVVSSSSRGRWRVMSAGVLATVAVAAGTVVMLRHRRLEEGAVLVKVASVSASPIEWARRLDGHTEWIDLHDGWFRLEIAPHDAERRVVIRTPDGRIEDLGTVLEVRIAEGRTTQVRVQQGHVQLWLNVAAGLVLGEGETWDSPGLAAPSPQTAAAPPSPPAVPARTGARRGSSKPAQAVPNASEQEDAVYLTVIRLLRSARQQEARAAAAEYLRRFPHGFRSDEMRRLTGGASPSLVKEPPGNGQQLP